MKLTIWKTLLLLFVTTVQHSYAQQTYFNVPSSDVVDKHKVSVQQQVSFGESFRAGTTVNYGLGREWEIGLNVYNLDYLPSERRFTLNDSTVQEAYGPLLLLNSQKAFDITKHIEVAVGMQAGVNMSPRSKSKLVGYAYAHVAGSFHDEHYNWSMGVYGANSRYAGEGRRTGYQAGFDAGIFYQKVHLLGDFISGQHSLGQLILGVEVYAGKHFPLSIGWQRANQDGAQALVLQLTYNPE
ncbi:hypothetical protein [Spirosoma utsteinense]|uniref:Outer membrane protein beta-barrel domain-containing protein n=1 Tax=Spirosoma utsteinense TaxID=2585773 RepID=A0ABR6W799_9BACT|nr:hypothetical protein [Spirosoma utsteinense]MBC3784895.1 hypothetical protein [Spirosoma utsteinense]MBC3792456.1 hypothetical protein [Spirosoma utsteinense]